MDHPSFHELKSAVLGPSNRMGDVLNDAPRLANVIAGLETDRAALLTEQATGDELVRRLIAYRQRAADLLYQAYGVDLGGET